MPYAAGQLMVGFTAAPGSAYLGWSAEEQREMKGVITSDILEVVPKAHRDAWRHVLVAVDAEGHLDDAGAVAFIQQRLDAAAADSAVQLTVSGGLLASATEVTYTWVDGVRVCEHRYLLDWAKKSEPGVVVPWLFAKDPTGDGSASSPSSFTAQLFAQLSWESDVSGLEPS